MELFPRPTNVEWAQVAGIIVMFLFGKGKFGWLARVLTWLIKPKEIHMELGKNATLEYKGGDIVLTFKAKSLALPEIEKIEAKVQSGEIDLIKGTDLDKAALLTAITAIKAELNK